ncbi:MAG TPA: hypothetical protein VGY48_15575 [Vicinamibacterales bacterium]|jgi:hypothetical protein|nr:hypothetical protein [Vicinamibacterales bacterium]
MDEAFWKDERKIEDMSFGAELTPKLIDFMKEHPWPDSAFVYNAPEFTYAPPEGAPDGFDINVDRMNKQAEFDKLAVSCRAEAFEGWKKRSAGLPTQEAIDAWKALHGEQIERVRALLRRCNVKIADDITKLGCTGAAHYGLSADDIKFLRAGLAGGGVGLPCFVPPTRYCFLHETTGGLQDGQAPGYSNVIESISRELTPEEIAHNKLVTEAQWSDNERGAFEKLRGRKLPEGWEANVDAIRKEGGIDDVVGAGKIRVPEGFSPPMTYTVAWQCSEHKKTNWQCRYCVAQAVVDGDIEPTYRLAVGTAVGDRIAVTDACAAARLAQEIAEEDKVGTAGLDVYVRVATFTRKLSRD